MNRAARRRALCAIAACVVVTLGSTERTALAQRLPDTVVPSHYAVTWTPDLADARFTGTEHVDVTVAAPTRTIALNALDLVISDARVVQAGRSSTASVSMDAAKQQVTLTLDSPLGAGPARLDLRFAGTLNDTLAGLYLSKTRSRRYAVTQFEATDARRAFPCFDEPALKATFDVAAVVDSGDMAISNMPVVSDVPGPAGKHTVTFQTTPRLSTYLIALLVGDFECLEGSQDGVPLRICSTPGHREEGRFALEATKAVLAYYHRYYGPRYPFPKLDQIAVPDFMAGAMENAGAIVYRETALLVHESTASIDQKQRVAAVIAHEMAHQWFGDLVTMAWWDDVWLNEGFATWMESKPLTEWKPAWEFPLQDVMSAGQALTTDAVPSTRPIKAPQADTPAEIDQLFDGISYGKAAAVLRMLEEYLGPDVFRRGVNAHLAQHAWKNATSGDFWAALASTSGKPVDAIMKSFVTQPGAPLLEVASACENGHQRVTVAQRRFFNDPVKLDAGSPERWSIPVCMRRPGELAKCELVDRERQVIDLAGCAPWTVANAEGRGYYRVLYADGSAERIGRAAGDLTPAERINFLQDQWALVSVGRQTAPSYLDLLGALGENATDRVMQVAWGPLDYIDQEILAPGDRARFAAWVRALATPYLERLGREPRAGDAVDVLRTRARVLYQLAVDGRDPEVIASLRRSMDAYLADPSSVPPSLVDTIVTASTRLGDAALFDRVVRTIETTKLPEVRSKLEYALANFENPAVLQRTLDRTLTPAVRNQDMLYVLLSALRHPDTRPMVWAFIKQHLSEIQSRSGSLASTAVVNSAGAMCDPTLRDDARAFFAAHPIEGTSRTLQQGLERADACIRLVATERPRVSAWLARVPASK